MSKKTTSCNSPKTDTAAPAAVGKTDWAALAAMTEDEVMTAAMADPDARPLPPDRVKKQRRVGLAGTIRFRLKLSRDDFCDRYQVPLATLEGWERGTIVPDSVASAYLSLIDADPDGIAILLAKARLAEMAEKRVRLALRAAAE